MSRDNTVITNNENKSNNFENKSNKQIEEIVKDFCPLYQEYGSCKQCNKDLAIDDEPCYYGCVANLIIDYGYRKSTEVAEEIFGEIEETFKECLWFLENHPSDYPRMDRTKINVYKDNLQYIAEIKNKYKGRINMADKMTFPATFKEFAEQYKIVDKEEVYTNGAELIPIFRVEQWLDNENNSAKKIFAEIEEMLNMQAKIVCKTRETAKEADEPMISWIAMLDGRIYSLRVVEEHIAELKKKYTEGE